jgi:hypothetical protein
MSYKVFSNGNVLNASELNEFLMNQSVIAFSNATARSSAITSPVEGMITYLEDNKSYQSYDGSAWVGLVPQSPNAIINGAFEINQRAFSSTTTSGAFGFDRWFLIGTDGTSTYSSQSFTPGAAPLAQFEGNNFARLVSTGQTATNAQTSLRQKIENVRTFTQNTVSLSFWARAASGTPKLALEITQNFGSGGSSDVQTYAGQVTLTTSFQRFTVTATIPSISGKTIGAGNYLEVVMFASAGSNFNARTGSLGIQSNTFDIWGVQLEAGSVATPFRRNANSLQGELAACQRYYYRTKTGAAFEAYGTGIGISTTSIRGLVTLPVSMRVPATSVDFANLAVNDTVATLALTSVAIGGLNATQETVGLLLGVAASGVQYRPYSLTNNNSTAGFIGFSAEL